VRHTTPSAAPGAPHSSFLLVLGVETASLLCSSRRVVPLGRELTGHMATAPGVGRRRGRSRRLSSTTASAAPCPTPPPPPPPPPRARRPRPRCAVACPRGPRRPSTPRHPHHRARRRRRRRRRRSRSARRCCPRSTRRAWRRAAWCAVQKCPFGVQAKLNALQSIP
jgi:hypothetical protein